MSGVNCKNLHYQAEIAIFHSLTIIHFRGASINTSTSAGGWLAVAVLHFQIRQGAYSCVLPFLHSL